MSAHSRTADSPTLSRRPRGTTRRPHRKLRREQGSAAVVPLLRRCPLRTPPAAIRSSRRAYQPTCLAQLAERTEFPSRGRVVRPPTGSLSSLFESLPRRSQCDRRFASRRLGRGPIPRSRRHHDAARRIRELWRVAPALSDSRVESRRPEHAAAREAAAADRRSRLPCGLRGHVHQASTWRLGQPRVVEYPAAAGKPVRAKRGLPSRLAPVSGLSEQHRRDDVLLAEGL